MVAAITITTITITIVVTAAVLVVLVDGFVIVIHNLPAPPHHRLLPSRSPTTRWPLTSTFSFRIELKSFTASTKARHGTWKKWRKHKSSLSTHSISSAKTSTTNIDGDDDNDAISLPCRRTMTTKEKYLQLSQEAYIQYFSSSGKLNVQNQSQQKIMTLDEYLDLAMAAWNVTNEASRCSVLPFLPSPENNPTTNASLTALKATYADASRNYFASSVMKSNSTDRSDSQGNSASAIVGGDQSSESSDFTSIFESFLKGWMGVSSGINNSFFGGESSSSSSNNNGNLISAIRPSRNSSNINNKNDDNVNDEVQIDDCKERQHEHIPQPLTKYLSQPQLQLPKTMVPAASETKSTTGMTNTFGEGNISGEDEIDDDDTDDAVVTVTMPEILTPAKEGPINFDTLNEMGVDIRCDGKDVNEKYQHYAIISDLAPSVTAENETLVTPPSFMSSIPPLKGRQRQQQRLPSLSGTYRDEPEMGSCIVDSPEDRDDISNESDGIVSGTSASKVIAGAGSTPSLTPSTMSPVLQRRTTPITSIPAAVPLRGSFNVMTQVDTSRIKPPISTGNRSKMRSMPPSLSIIQEGKRQQLASELPSVELSANAIKGSAPIMSTNKAVNSRERLKCWGGSAVPTTYESFNSNQDIQPTNDLKGETMGGTISGFELKQLQAQQTKSDLISNSLGEFNGSSGDATRSGSIGTVFPSGQGSGLPHGMKTLMASPAQSLSSRNWEIIAGNQEQEPIQSPQFQSTSEFFKYGRDDYPSMGWPKSSMGWEGDGLGDVNKATDSSKDAVDVLWAFSMNDLPEPSHFPLLHIGSRIRSNVHGTTHAGYLFTSDESSDGTTGYNRYRVMPCIAKRPWSLSELNATVPAQVLSLERGQQSDSLQNQQPTLEPWELETKAVAVRRYFEVEIHMYQKFEEKKRFYGMLRRQQLQDEDGRDQDSEMTKRGDAAIMSNAEVTIPNFVRVYADDGSGGPNTNDAIAGYGKTGFDVWGKTLDPGHEWLVYEGSLETEVTLSEAMIQGRRNEGTNRLCGIQRSMNLPETFTFGDVLDSVCRSLLEDLVFLSSCNVVHRDIRTFNILCDSEHRRLRLSNFGNAVDLDPPRVGIDNDRLVVDVPVSIANTLAADVFSVAIIICHLMFDVSEKSLNRQLKVVGYDLDTWLRQALTEESDSEVFEVAFDYLRERRGFWSFLKGAIRPNPLRKKITSDSLRQFDEILALKSGDIDWTEERTKKVAQEEAYLVSMIRLPDNDFVEGSNLVQPTEEMEASKVTAPHSCDGDMFDITRVPFTLQPPTKSRASVLSELSKKLKQPAPNAPTSDDGAPPSFGDSEYSDLTRIQFSPPRKSSLTAMLTSYSKQKSFVLKTKREALRGGKYYDITRAPFQRVSPQLQEMKTLAIEIQFPDPAPEDEPFTEVREVKHIVAPPGKLGVAVDTPANKGPAYVSSIRDDSPLLGRIILGDVIIAVDDQNVQTLVADEVSKILLTKSTNARRTISVLRKIENMKERRVVDLGGQLAAYEFDPGSNIANQQALADHFDDIAKWILGILPHLQQEDVSYYRNCLMSDGFDSLHMLEELVVDDLYFMKKAHKRAMSRQLSKRQPPPEMMEESCRMKKVYTVNEVLGVAARKGIEAMVAEEKKLAVKKAEKEKYKEAKQRKTNNGAQPRSIDEEASEEPIIKKAKE